MPHLKVTTNVDQAKFDDEFMSTMTSTLAKLTGKPEKYIMVQVSGGKKMTFSGTPDPTAFVTFTSIGAISEEKNASYAGPIFEALNKRGIPSDRIYIEFRNTERTHMAWNNKLFSQ